MNLREFIDNDADLDSRLLKSDTEALTTLDRLLDVEATLVIIKKATSGQTYKSAARVESPGPKAAP